MIDNNTVSTGLISDLSIQSKTKEEPKSNELGQDAFLKLMITQMNNQNPLEPQANSEFVAQLAQFSSVEGLDKMNNTLTSMAGSFQSSQALQASSLVGRTVMVESSHAELNTEGNIRGSIDIPYSTSSLELNIYDSNDQLVAKQMLGTQSAGELPFSWNGQSMVDGNRLPPGQYRVAAVASNNGEPEEFATAVSANVDSVTVGGNGTVTLNVAGAGQVPMSAVKEII